MTQPCLKVRRVSLLAGLAWTIAGQSAAGQEPGCKASKPARFWELGTDYWSSADTTAPAPEWRALNSKRTHDVGVAFSGGGNRSATATLGQLRGLKENGWLPNLTYMSAISGGSWGAVPFTFYRGNLDSLLGKAETLTTKNILNPNGGLAGRIVESAIRRLAVWEVPSFFPKSGSEQSLVAAREAVITVRGAIGKLRGHEYPEGDRANKAYARILGRVFLEGLMKDALVSSYAWDDHMVTEISDVTHCSPTEFITPLSDRPFLIVGATAVKEGEADYPRLIPVEYTPMYTGIRQQFGAIGGTYVWPWAYDRESAAPLSSTQILVGPGPQERRFTLADMMASSGAAPQLAMIIGDYIPGRLRKTARSASQVFPAFSNLATRDHVPNAPSMEIAHGDGGFVDNLGLMPLLARQVHNIIVFVNSADPYPKNGDIPSYFFPLDERTGSGDKSMNAVFKKDLYMEVIHGFDMSVNSGGPAVYCGSNWSVAANELYNSRSYTGLNICWVYNYAADDWKTHLQPDLQALLKAAKEKKKGLTKSEKKLASFPYYATFEENKPEIIQLDALQVNFLADLSYWTITNPKTKQAILAAFKPGSLP